MREWSSTPCCVARSRLRDGRSWGRRGGRRRLDDELVEVVDDLLCVGLAGRLDARIDLLAAERRQRLQLNIGDQLDMLQRDAGYVGLHASEDRDLAVVRGHEVLLLRPVGGRRTE